MDDGLGAMTKRIARCRDVARRLLGMDSSGWKISRDGRFEGVLMVKISLERYGDPIDLPDNELMAAMQIEASEKIGLNLPPYDGVDRVPDRPPDLRTAAGRKWKRDHAGAGT
jgi:hypothetical protein